MNSPTLPLVSIVCITYNHEPYLRKALDGFLMQKTNFPYEIILAEDCSTDGTRQICEEYKAKYPELITYICRTHNVGVVENERQAIEASRGKYLAFCEGDDYWIEPKKLQWQVDFLESNYDYAVVFHQHGRCVKNNEIVKYIPSHEMMEKFPNGFDITHENLFSPWVTQYLSMMCRKIYYDNELPKQFAYWRDTHQVYYLLKQGKGRMMSFLGGIYRITSDGMFTNKSQRQMVDTIIAVDTELFKKNVSDVCVRNALIKDLMYRLAQFSDSSPLRERYNDISMVYNLNHNFVAYVKNVVKYIFHINV